MRGSGRPVLLLHGDGATLEQEAGASVAGSRSAAAEWSPWTISPLRLLIVGPADVRPVGSFATPPPPCSTRWASGGAIGSLSATPWGGADASGKPGETESLAEILSEHVAGLVLINKLGPGSGGSSAHVSQGRRARLGGGGAIEPSTVPRHRVRKEELRRCRPPGRLTVAAARAIGFDSPVARRRGFARRLLGIDLTEALATTTFPVLALAGSADRAVLPEGSAEIAALIPGARFELLEGAGHPPPMERSAEVAHLIVQLTAESACV